jgi:hypothetical protein
MMRHIRRRRFLLFFLALWLWSTAALGAQYGYSYIPKKLYLTQVFPVTVLASDADTKFPPTFRFDPKAAVQPLDPAPTSMINGSDTFYTFYFKADQKGTLTLPDLVIYEANRSIPLPGRSIEVTPLDATGHPAFCGLIATDCTIETSQVSSFDANKTLVTIRIRAHEANPEAMHVPGAIEDGLEYVRREHALVRAEYYFVIPASRTRVEVQYYNTAQRRFISKTIDTDYRAKPVAAQVELNPKASPIERLKQYGSIGLALFFALMFLWQRDRLYLLLFLITLAALYVVYKPRETLCVREGSSLYILPARNSRVSTTIRQRIETLSLGTHGDYYKINYANGTIGWIRHEDLCQN